MNQTEREYQELELAAFKASKNAFFDTPTEFSAHLAEAGPKWAAQQAEWIENGSYGCGACLALRQAYEWAEGSARANKHAAVGRVILHALNGAPVEWRRLSKAAQAVIAAAVAAWYPRPRDWAASGAK
jgi:hypothetical protein